MSTALKLNTQELVLLNTILEVRATNLAAFIKDTDYGAYPTPDHAEAVRQGYTWYLADIRAVQAKIQAKINDAI
jgi:hypothetical protein